MANPERSRSRVILVGQETARAASAPQERPRVVLVGHEAARAASAPQERPRVVLVGAGAMGLAFAERLSDVAEVLLVARGSTLEVLREKGLTVTGLDGTVAVRRMPAVSPDWGDAPPGWGAPCAADLLFLFTKAFDSREAAREAARHVRPAACVTLQNGLGNVEALAEAFGASRVVGGTTTVGVTWEGPARVRIAGRGDTALGETPDTDTPWGAPRIARLLVRAGIAATVTEDLPRALWTKVCVNVGINPLTALHRIPNGKLLDGGPLEAELEAAVREAAAVARAEGVDLDPDAAVARCREVAVRTAANHSSMLQSVERGGRTEIEALCGEVVARGRTQGVPTPANERLLEQVRAVERRP